MGSRAAWVLALGIAAFSALGALRPALAQGDYPNRTVTLVVPYPPGGGVDVLARVVAEKLSGVLGHQSSSIIGSAAPASLARAR